jgi:hypothetical protein
MPVDDATEVLLKSLAERASKPARATYMRESCPGLFTGDEFTPARLSKRPLAPVLTEDQVAASEHHYSFVDCTLASGPVHRYSFEGYDPEDATTCEDVTIDAIPVESASLCQWLQSWIDGRPNSSCSGRTSNPVT